MKISLILAHPNPKSFNHALAQVCKETLLVKGHQVFFHDLYTEKFDPLLPYSEFNEGTPLPPAIAEHCEELAQADGIIIVHPNWWGLPPAILTGWVDRILRPGQAYRFLEGDQGEGVPVGLLKARAAVVLNTSNTNEQREMEVFGDPLERIWKDCVFRFCGVSEFHRRIFRIICVSSEWQRRQWLEETRLLVRQIF